MRTPRTRAGLALLVVTGMLLLFGGVVAGSAVGTLLRPELEGRPLLLGQSNSAGESPTRLFGTTSGGALWATQRGPGAAVRGDSASGRGGVFVTGHRSASGVLAANEAGDVGNGAAVIAQGNNNVGVRASSESVAIIADGQALALFAAGDSLVAGDLTIEGGCTGCLITAIAINQSDAALGRGDAVTLVGKTTDQDGMTLLEVAAAGPGDRVFGIVMEAATRIQVSTDLESAVAVYQAADHPTEPGAPLRVAIGGIIDYARADTSGGTIQAGDSLASSNAVGFLSKAATGIAPGLSVGYALSAVDNGLIAVLIDRH